MEGASERAMSGGGRRGRKYERNGVCAQSCESAGEKERQRESERERTRSRERARKNV